MRSFTVKINGKTYNCEVEETTAGAVTAPAAAPVVPAAAPKAAAPAPVAAAPAPAPAAPTGGTQVAAPLPGTVLRIVSAQGAAVKKGDIVVVLEAMKMENEIFAPCDGTVTSMSATVGAPVNSGDPLFVIG